MELKHIVGYLPYGLKYNLPLTSERYESILENECYGVIELPWAIENNYPNAENYLKMTFTQTNPFIAIEDDKLFLGQMKCNLGWEEDDVFLEEVKPILRPLSDLTKEIEVNGEKFVPIERLLDIETKHNWSNSDYLQSESGQNEWWVKLKGDKPSYIFGYNSIMGFYLINQFSEKQFIRNQIELFEKLYEWHFDIHGLIEKEDAEKQLGKKILN